MTTNDPIVDPIKKYETVKDLRDYLNTLDDYPLLKPVFVAKAYANEFGPYLIVTTE